MKTSWSFTLVLALAVGVACRPAERSGNVADGPGDPNAMEVTMVDSEFHPNALTAETGTEVTIEVTNDGSAVHDFTIDALDLSTGGVDPGGVMTATLMVPDGTTEFRCTIHPGMRGEILGQ